jgi:hypothetical protein
MYTISKNAGISIDSRDWKKLMSKFLTKFTEYSNKNFLVIIAGEKILRVVIDVRSGEHRVSLKNLTLVRILRYTFYVKRLCEGYPEKAQPITRWGRKATESP